MSIFKFLMGQKTMMSKEEVISSISSTTQIIREYTLPAAKTAAQLWTGQKFKSNAAKDIQSSFLRSVKGKSLFDAMADTMENTLVLLGFIQEYAERIFSNTEANIGLTYSKAMTLRLTQAAEVANVYSRRLINYIYWLESEALGSEVVGPKQGEIDWLDSNFDSYCVAMKALQKDKDQLEQSFKQLPDAVVSSNTEMTFTSTLGLNKIDPLGLNQLSVRWNPFYLIGMLVAEWQVDRYKQAKDELQLLEYRKLQIERLREKGQDAKLDQEIEYLQERITGVHAKLDKMEKTYHV